MLEHIETDRDLQRFLSLGEDSAAILEILAMDSPLDRAFQLGDWSRRYPSGTWQLLTVVARQPRLAAAFARGVIAWGAMETTDSDWLEAVDEILLVAFATLEGGWRDAAAERPRVRERHGIVDFEPLPSPIPWPDGSPLPDVEQVAGVQARLNLLGYGAGRVTNEWTQLWRRALARWQISIGLPPTGERDDETMDSLEYRANDRLEER